MLNAKQHEREAWVIAQAGSAGRGDHRDQHGRSRRRHPARRQSRRPGRGVPQEGRLHARRGDEEQRQQAWDEANAQCERDADRVRLLGGLHVLGTERHEAPHRQPAARPRGRQGDQGSSRFFVSLEDELMRRFGGASIAGLMDKLGLEEDVPLEHSWVTRAIENAQQKVEAYNFISASTSSSTTTC